MEPFERTPSPLPHVWGNEVVKETTTTMMTATSRASTLHQITSTMSALKARGKKRVPGRMAPPGPP